MMKNFCDECQAETTPWNAGTGEAWLETEKFEVTITVGLKNLPVDDDWQCDLCPDCYRALVQKTVEAYIENDFPDHEIRSLDETEEGNADDVAAAAKP